MLSVSTSARATVFVALLLGAAACRGGPQRADDIEDPTSPLLDMLIQDSDFPGAINWEQTFIRQPSQPGMFDAFAPTRVDSAQVQRRCSRGVFGATADCPFHRLEFSHSLVHMVHGAAVAGAMDEFKKLVDFGAASEYGLAGKLDLDELGDSRVGMCITQGSRLVDPTDVSAQAKCMIMVRYDDILSIVELSMPISTERSDIDELIVTVLEKIDARIAIMGADS